MKFFTLETYNAWYHGPDNESHKVLRLKQAEFARYTGYIESLRGQIPDELITLALLRGVDDGLIADAYHDRAERLFTLTLACGDAETGAFDLLLRYEDADISPDDLRLLARLARGMLPMCDLYRHEIELMDGGRIVHRLLFHPGVWVAIECRALTWTKVATFGGKLPRRGRSPRIRDRFPRRPLWDKRPFAPGNPGEV